MQVTSRGKNDLEYDKTTDEKRKINIDNINIIIAAMPTEIVGTPTQSYEFASFPVTPITM